MSRLAGHLRRGIFGLLLAVGLLLTTDSGAQAVPIGTVHSVILAWQAPSPVGGSGTIIGYNVYRSPLTPTNYAKVNTVLNAGLSFTDLTVAAGASYSYCVTTVDSLNEESVCSAAATANVPANPNAPSAPLITVK